MNSPLDCPWIALGLGVWAGCALACANPAPLLEAQYRVDGAIPQSLALVGSDASRAAYWEGTFALEVSAADLSVGPHFVEVRMRGTNGVWSAWQGQWFRVAGAPGLTAAEWFVDADPGPGRGTPVAWPQDGAWGGAEEDFEVSGVSVDDWPTGRHALFVRARDSNGDWGLTNATVFYAANAVAVVAAEWTANPWSEPGTGARMEVTTDPSPPPGETGFAATSNTLSVGTNYCATYPLYVRVQDNLGRWSTRGGWTPDPGGAGWRFDPALGWIGARTALVVAPETAREPVLCDGCLTNNGALRLGWSDCRGVTGYQVFGRGALTEPFELWATVGAPGFAPAGTLTNGTYSWFVRSLGGAECALDGPVWNFTVTTPRADDADNDGIPDAWERREFGGALFRSNGATDWDGDGAKDWQEYVADTSPTDPADVFRLAGCRVVPGGVALHFPTAAGRTYTVYYALGVDGRETVWNWFDQLIGTGTAASVTNLWPDPRGFFEVSVTAP